MEVIRAKVLGFCMGVRRAVETAEQSVSKNSAGTKIYTLGPLIHNPVVLNDLEKKGVSVLTDKNLDQAQPDSIVIIRAHGTTPQVQSYLESHNHTVLDATCPKVHLSQKRAAEWNGKGFTIIIAGDRNHGEVVSISAYAGGNALVIENPQEAEALDVPEKAVLIAQTTFSPVEFEKIKSILKEKNPQIQIFNSICSATMERQDALSQLEGKTDGILVIGGKSSANTRRLYERAASICKNAALIENASEIPPEFFKMQKVGLTAGASTPDNIIEEVEELLLQNN
ncbi:4-hydroxy-3-methylbut-2-enyl diphosphate reductase [Treponema sp.]|uniref:4-hydroxy-3-methylbut-2-enyl diphosphate reductase n=1 Tax=Treponema sp. TaxID=166 RepID=UPI0025D10047|nr:4-hydroxy-3-methylbut-2-enyl diphosphate reductase [Treponema sp.]MCR5219357.1 4-hydroxy-3-methylbut-2-enyl diphosphate reductase [Treponema sp.]